MIIDRLEVGVFAENCYVVGCEKSGEGVIIDPGDEPDRIVRKVEERQLNIRYILVTHGHLDHVKELNAVKKSFAVPVLMHRDDEFLLENLPAQAAAFGLTVSGIPKIDRYIVEGEQVTFGEITLRTLHTPGHSPGSVTFYADDVAFVGDALFAGSIGRTDLPGGDLGVLLNSIKSTLVPLGDKTVVYPGHGPETTIAIEKSSNPFLQDNFSGLV